MLLSNNLMRGDWSLKKHILYEAHLVYNNKVCNDLYIKKHLKKYVRRMEIKHKLRHLAQVSKAAIFY